MRFSLAGILIVNLCMAGLPGETRFNTKLLISARSYASPPAIALQSVSRRKRVKNTSVRQIDAEGLKELLHIGKERERPLLVNFWATWCQPCVAEFPDLIQVSNKYDSSKLDFVTVSLDEVSDIKTKVSRFLKRVKAKMPAYLLNATEPEEAIRYVSETWSGELPATFLIDRQGQIVFKHMGRIKPDELFAAIETLYRK